MNPHSLRKSTRILWGLALSAFLCACPEKKSQMASVAETSDASSTENGAILSDPASIDSLYLAGQQEFLNGNFAKAAEHYRSILFMEKSARAWHALGDVNMATMQFNAAVDAFREALKLEPQKRMSMMRLGRALQRSGRFAEAVEAYRQAQRVEPEEASAYRYESEALVPLQRIDEAIERLQKAALLEKDASQKAQNYQAMGDLEVKREKMAQAALFFEQAIAASPSVELYVALAEAELRAGRLGKSRDAFREAARIEEREAEVLAAHRETVLKLETAIAAHREAARSEGHDNETPYREAVSEHEKAVAAYRELRQRMGDRAEARDPFYWEAVGELELRLKDTAAAREAFLNSLQIAPRALVHIALGRLALTEGDDGEAREQLGQALSVTEGTSQEVREMAHMAARLKDWSLAEKLLLTLLDSEDTEDMELLWLEIAALRQALGREDGVTEACTKANEAFSAKHPRVKSSCPPSGASSPLSMPAHSIDDQEMARCQRAMSDAQQGKLDGNEALLACQKIFEQQAAFSKLAKDSGLPSTPIAGEAIREACPQVPGADISWKPKCPPDDAPWQK